MRHRLYYDDIGWISANICRNYRKTSSTSRTKSQSLNVSCILVQLFSLNPLKPGVKLRTKMYLEQRRQATSELSTIWLPTKVRLIEEVLRYTQRTKCTVCVCVFLRSLDYAHHSIIIRAYLRRFHLIMCKLDEYYMLFFCYFKYYSANRKIFHEKCPHSHAR